MYITLIQEDQVKEDDQGDEPSPVEGHYSTEEQTATRHQQREQPEPADKTTAAADPSHSREPTEPSDPSTEPTEPSETRLKEPEKEKEKRTGGEGEADEEVKEGEEVKEEEVEKRDRVVVGEKEKNVKRLVINDLPGDTVEELLR